MKSIFSKRSIYFIGLVFLFDWLLIALFYAAGGKWNTNASIIISVIYMFIPMIIAVTLQRFIYHQPIKEPLGIKFKPNIWYFIAWVLPLFISLASFGVSLIFSGISYSPDMAGMFERYKYSLNSEQISLMKEQIQTLPIHPFWLTLGQAMIGGATTNTIAGFGEELGWRGFLYNEFLGLGFYRSSLLIGTIWGIWHMPIILMGHNYPQHPVFGVLMMTLWCILLSPIFSFIRERSDSVIATSILHGTINGTFVLSILLLKGGNDLIIGITGISGFIVLIMINILIFFNYGVKGTSPLLGVCP
ncbi:MAG: CPBP family intramembrane metalloprotease [Nitrospirae bacterium]|nr:CPBP family intramembrane metalloprotease [Nitrospirota bacterium]